ncbi:prepilin-type N-terminal cleavage/methylation domain-containing protein [bacterium]|nr:prepilin-type N-terminal cleavage/methylation domain-containing protein [bacterium]
MKWICKHHESKSIRGFTLIELLVSVSLMTGILMASYVCLQAALTGRSMVENRSDTLQTARVVMEMIAADLRSADRLSEQHEILGLDRTLEGIEADNIDFVTRHHTPKLPMEADYCEVSYFVLKNPETERFVLLRRRDALPDDKPLEGGQREPLIDDLLGLKFEYYDGWDWYDDWGDAETPEETTETEESSLIASAGRTGFPEAVRVTLMIPEKSGPRQIPESVAEPGTSPMIPGAMVFQTIVHLNLAHSDVASENSGTGNIQSPGNMGNIQR